MRESFGLSAVFQKAHILQLEVDELIQKITVAQKRLRIARRDRDRLLRENG